MAKGRPSKRRNKKNKSFCSIRIDPKTGEALSTEIPPEEVQDMNLYIRSHNLIPWDYTFGSPASYQMVKEATELLGEKVSSSKEVLRSLAILGHSPCPEAYTALSAYIGSDKIHAGVASFALDECIGLSEAWCA